MQIAGVSNAARRLDGYPSGDATVLDSRLIHILAISEEKRSTN